MGHEGQGKTGPRDPIAEFRGDYLTLGIEFYADMILMDYCLLMYRNRSIKVQMGNMQAQNMEFIKKVGKLTIPSFEGSSNCHSQAWVQNIDTYFKLKYMTYMEAISFTTLHLEGESHEWWYHGTVTLGHSHITSYLEFIEPMMERFDQRDPKLHFKDLTHLRQTRLIKAFTS
jgi:hypothetical protein